MCAWRQPLFKRILFLNGIGVIALVINHAADWGLQAMFDWTDRYMPVSVPNYDQLGTLPFYITVWIRQLVSIDIPAFLFVSGFFIAYAAGREQPNLKWKVVFNRIKVLIPPFIIWTIVRYILLRQVPSSVHDVLMPVFYIPLITQFYLISPFIVSIVQKRWKLMLVATLITTLSIKGLRYLFVFDIHFKGLDQLIALTEYYIFPMSLFWFVFGMVYGFHFKDFSQRLEKIKWGLLIGCIVFGALIMVEYSVLWDLSGRDWLGRGVDLIFTKTIYRSLFLLTFLAFYKAKLPFQDKLSKLGSKSLGVYVVNQNANYVVALFMYFVTPWILGIQIMYQSIIIAVGLGIPLLLMAIVNRPPTRKYYRYLFG